MSPLPAWAPSGVGRSLGGRAHGTREPVEGSRRGERGVNGQRFCPVPTVQGFCPDLEVQRDTPSRLNRGRTSGKRRARSTSARAASGAPRGPRGSSGRASRRGPGPRRSAPRPACRPPWPRLPPGCPLCGRCGSPPGRWPARGGRSAGSGGRTPSWPGRGSRAAPLGTEAPAGRERPAPGQASCPRPGGASLFLRVWRAPGLPNRADHPRRDGVACALGAGSRSHAPFARLRRDPPGLQSASAGSPPTPRWCAARPALTLPGAGHRPGSHAAGQRRSQRGRKRERAHRWREPGLLERASGCREPGLLERASGWLGPGLLEGRRRAGLLLGGPGHG